MRPVFSCSATDVDQYCRWSDGEIDTDEFLARIRRQAPPTRKQLAGTAFHAALASMAPRCVGKSFSEMKEGEFSFRIDGQATLIVPVLSELPVRLRMEMGDYDAVIRCRVDGIVGNTVIDYKLTERFDAERLISGMQWRIYLLATGLGEFRWIGFESPDLEADPVVISRIYALSQYAYEGMDHDVRRNVSGFADAAASILPELWARQDGVSA